MNKQMNIERHPVQSNLKESRREKIQEQQKNEPVQRLKSPRIQSARTVNKSVDQPTIRGIKNKINEENQLKPKPLKKGTTKKKVAQPNQEIQNNQPSLSKQMTETSDLTQKLQQINEKLTTEFQQEQQKQIELEKLSQMQDQIQKEEDELQEVLSQIDQRIQVHKNDQTKQDPPKLEISELMFKTPVPKQQFQQFLQSSNQVQQFERSPIEQELQKTIVQLREENEKLRNQQVNSSQDQIQINQKDTEKLKNIIKELNAKLIQKNTEVDDKKKIIDDLNKKNQIFKQNNEQLQKQNEECTNLIQKLRLEFDSQCAAFKKIQNENQSLQKRIEEVMKTSQERSPSQLGFQQNELETKMQIQILQDQVSEQQQKNRLLTQQNENLSKFINDMQREQKLVSQANVPAEQNLIRIAELESQNLNYRQELEDVTAERDKFYEQIESTKSQCQSLQKTIEQLDLEMNEKDDSVAELQNEMVKLKQKMGEYLNAVFEMGGADMVEMIEQKIHYY